MLQGGGCLQYRGGFTEELDGRGSATGYNTGEDTGGGAAAATLRGRMEEGYPDSSQRWGDTGGDTLGCCEQGRTSEVQLQAPNPLQNMNTDWLTQQTCNTLLFPFPGSGGVLCHPTLDPMM